MRKFGKALGRILSVLVIIGAVMWVFGPYEPVDLNAGFDPAKFESGVQAYFDTQESRYDDITPGVEKRVIWAGEPEVKTTIAVVYIHGFSATSEEIRPVPDEIAKALDANLVFTRLRGHGRGSAAMADPTAGDWMKDTAEALAAGRAVGDRVVLITTSTGGTLAAAAALDPKLSQDVAAMIFVSPNFGINSPLAPILTFPAARYWLPLVAGSERSFEPVNEGQAKFWTTSYPSVAAMPMAALVKTVVTQDFSAARVPALFWYSDDDKVVRPDITDRIAARWGGPAKVQKVTMGPGDDKGAHVIAGAIKSPGQTDAAVAGMLAWLNTVLGEG